MTNRELIAKLQKLPLEMTVFVSNSDGCFECNPEGLPNYHDPDPRYLLEGEYPYHDRHYIVVL